MGFLAGSVPLHRLATRLISFYVLSLRTKRTLQALAGQAELQSRKALSLMVMKNGDQIH